MSRLEALAVGKLCKAIFCTSGEEGNSDGYGLPPGGREGGVLISASSVPHCGISIREKDASNIE